jgi:uncharacterized membrane protein YebE (DUF533 family)
MMENGMSFGNIIAGLLKQGMSSQTHNRLRTGARNADGGGIEQMLGAFLGNRSTPGSMGSSGTSSGGLADMARDFLGKQQAGGMSGAKIGGLGALAGGLLGGGLGGAAKGGAMAVLGTLALKAYRDHQAQSGSAQSAHAATNEEVDALTSSEAEHLVLQAMIGAAQVDGHVDERELEKILGHLGDNEVTEDERRQVRQEVQRPVDVQALGAQVSRPEVATEVYLAALLAIDIDTEAERSYLRRLASSLRLEQGVVDRLHRLTDSPAP